MTPEAAEEKPYRPSPLMVGGDCDPRNNGDFYILISMLAYIQGGRSKEHRYAGARSALEPFVTVARLIDEH